MARTHGRAPRGQRLPMSVPHGHWHTSTVIAGLTLRGIVAPCVLDGPVNRVAYETYVEQVLVPELWPRDLVMLDNLSGHNGSRVRDRVHTAAAQLVFLPPYSPDFNPIELAFSKLKSLLRKAAEGSPKASGTPSDASSTPSRQPNAATTSRPPDMIQVDRITL